MAFQVSDFAPETERDWILFCENHVGCWAHHRGVPFYPKESNLSFLVKEDNQIVAICPLIKEGSLGAHFGLSIPGVVMSSGPDGSKVSKKLKSFIFQEIDRRAMAHGLKRVSYGSSEAGNYNDLTRYHFNDISLNKIHIDLTLNPDELWRNLSKGHRSDLKKHSPDFEHSIVCVSNTDLVFEDFSKKALSIEEFTPTHIKYLFQLYLIGIVEFIDLYRTGPDQAEQLQGSALFLKYKETVQYHEAQKFVQTPDPVHHLILWNAIRTYQQSGLKTVDLGVFSFSSQIHFPSSPKKESVALFKRGFGGSISPFFLGEKFYCPVFFEHYYTAKIKRYKESILEEASRQDLDPI